MTKNRFLLKYTHVSSIYRVFPVLRMSGSDSGGHGLGVLMAIIFLAGEMAGVGVLALPKVGNDKIPIRLHKEKFCNCTTDVDFYYISTRSSSILWTIIEEIGNCLKGILKSLQKTAISSYIIINCSW